MNDYKIYDNTKLLINTYYFLNKNIPIKAYKIIKEEKNINNNKKIFYFQTYSWSFGHVLISCLLGYSVFLNNYEKFKNFEFANIELNKKNHISDFIEIISKIEKKKIINLTNGDYYFEKLGMEKLDNLPRKFFPDSIYGICDQVKLKIKKYIFKKKNNYPKKIALIKTSSELDGRQSKERHFNKNNIIRLCENTGFYLLDYMNMHLEEILNYIYNCEILLVSWGATSYYNIFLEKNQLCICFVSNEYINEINREWICLSSKIYKYRFIKKPVSKELLNNELFYLQNEINKISH